MINKCDCKAIHVFEIDKIKHKKVINNFVSFPFCVINCLNVSLLWICKVVKVFLFKKVECLLGWSKVFLLLFCEISVFRKFVYVNLLLYICKKQMIMDFIKNRRTIRNYQQKDIPAELLNQLLEEAFRASTMGNMQLYSVVVTRSTEMKAKLAPSHFNQPMVTKAPVVLTFCADFNRFSKWCEFREAEPGYDNPISFLNAASDTLLVTQNFCTLAEAHGLGICYLGTTIYNPDQIIDTLQLPKLVMPVATITVGYPDEEPVQTDRLPLEGILHEEVYSDYTRGQIDRIYAFKESLPENHRFIAENGKTTLAQVFTDVRYKKADNEFMSNNLKNTLKKQGFDK